MLFITYGAAVILTIWFMLHCVIYKRSAFASQIVEMRAIYEKKERKLKTVQSHKGERAFTGQERGGKKTPVEVCESVLYIRIVCGCLEKISLN